MDVAGTFTRSLDAVWNNKTSIVPVLVYLLFMTVLGAVLLDHLGLASLVADVATADEASVEDPITAFDWEGLATLSTAVTLTATFLIWFIVSLYLNSTLFVTLAQLVAGEVSITAAFRDGFWYMPQLFGLKLAWTALLLIATAVTGGVTVVSWMIHDVLGVFTALGMFLVLLGVSFYLFVKLIFPLPRMYMDHDGPIDAMRNSYSMTGGRFKDALLVTAVVFGITVLASGLGGEPVWQLFTALFATASPFLLLLYAALFILFITVQAFIITLADAYRFFAYHDFGGHDG